MNIAELSYKTNIASREEIFNHLNECSSTFIPHLDERVNILDYSEKIFLESITFEVWASNKIIGLLAAYFNDFVTHSAYITNVSIDKQYFGLGLASSLLKKCIAYAKLNNFSNILLEVDEANTVAVNLYKKFGFLSIDRKGSSFIMKLDVVTCNL